MCALPSPLPSGSFERLAEALVTAAAALPPSAGGLPLSVPGVPVRNGRFALGRRLRSLLPPAGDDVLVVVGFGTAAWLGPPSSEPPALGELIHRSETSVCPRNRVAISRHARAWLSVENPALFDAVVMPAPGGGVLLIPVESFAERCAAVKP
jgi:hypothetical protein